MLTMAIATSIDALAVGITFALEDFTEGANVFVAVLLIGAITCALSMGGVKIGNIFGSRYEKKANKPVFMIYAPAFPEKRDMVAYFDRRCRESGFAGIEIIETFSDSSRPENYAAFRKNLCPQTKRVYIREPAVSSGILNRRRLRSPMRIVRKALRTLSHKGIISWVDKYSGDDLYRIMQEDPCGGEDVCHGAFFSWDNTPRHGVRGYVITPPSKESFLRYADSVRDDDYVFINAWNEWAEGMILEPTEHEGFKYLSWIQEWNDQNRKQ